MTQTLSLRSKSVDVWPMNAPDSQTDVASVLPPGFLEFYRPLHDAFAEPQEHLIGARSRRLAAAHAGNLPNYSIEETETDAGWRIELPVWCLDQRNQMTGPADDAELVVKMLNSGAPGVMLDLEDSMVNTWPALVHGAANMIAALHGSLSYEDRKSGRRIAIQPETCVIWNRVRGLHLHQKGIFEDALTPAALFDVALLAFCLDVPKLRHPLCIYIPKSESAEEALWWRDVFQGVAQARGWPKTWIKCMALLEAHPLAYELETFAYNLREHLLGINLGRWDYMASLIHYTFADPAWLLPDRNTIPHDVAFFQRVRERLVHVAHAHGLLAIGGMTALYPSREDPELNARALATLRKDKENESLCFMDGAWTGHPDQNEIAVAQFPYPNQLEKRPLSAAIHPDLRPVPTEVGNRSEGGTRAAIRTVIRYRKGVLDGKGASLLDGYMEDLATDRIYRLMIAQRILHGMHSAHQVREWFAQEDASLGSPSCGEAARTSQKMIESGEFNPH